MITQQRHNIGANMKLTSKSQRCKIACLIEYTANKNNHQILCDEDVIIDVMSCHFLPANIVKTKHQRSLKREF